MLRASASLRMGRMTGRPSETPRPYTICLPDQHPISARSVERRNFLKRQASAEQVQCAADGEVQPAGR